MNKLITVTAIIALLVLPTNAAAQTRDEQVRHDRQQLKDDDAWYYDDLESGIQAAATASKPMMVVLRCIP